MKLENANDNLRAIFDKRFNTAGKSFGLSNKKALKRFNLEQSMKPDNRFRSNMPTDFKLDLSNSKFHCEEFITPLKSLNKSINQNENPSGRRLFKEK